MGTKSLMPWKEMCRMQEKLRFINAYLEGFSTMVELCDEFGVSRPTGYELVRRFEAEGVDGLKERSRARMRQMHATPDETVELILVARRKHPSWGPRKILAWLRRHHVKRKFPATSTVGEILKRHGLITPRRRRRRASVLQRPIVIDEAVNATWATDFKGQFRLGSGRYCFPLTIQDACSRFLIGCQALTATTTEQARPVFEAAFRDYGLPRAMRSDNGSPFAAASLTGLTRLSVWWTKLGIRVERIDPGHPEQNGRLERFHRTLKLETATPPERGRIAQQRSFDRFRDEYNRERPHEALDQATPASLFRQSPRPFPKRVPKPEYGDGGEVRKVNDNGIVSFRGYHMSVSSALNGEYVQFEPTDDGFWRLRFYKTTLGEFDERQSLLRVGGASRMAKKVPSRRELRK